MSFPTNFVGIGGYNWDRQADGLIYVARTRTHTRTQISIRDTAIVHKWGNEHGNCCFTNNSMQTYIVTTTYLGHHSYRICYRLMVYAHTHTRMFYMTLLGPLLLKWQIFYLKKSSKICKNHHAMSPYVSGVSHVEKYYNLVDSGHASTCPIRVSTRPSGVQWGYVDLWGCFIGCDGMFH